MLHILTSPVAAHLKPFQCWELRECRNVLCQVLSLQHLNPGFGVLHIQLSSKLVKYMHKRGFDISEVWAFSGKTLFLEIGKVALPIVICNVSRKKKKRCYYRKIIIHIIYDNSEGETRTQILEGLSLARIFDFKNILFWQIHSFSVNFSISEK